LDTKSKSYELIQNAFNGTEKITKILNKPLLGYLLFRGIMHPLMFEKETERNKSLRYGFMRMGSGLSYPDELEAVKYFFLGLNELFRNMLDTIRTGKTLVWYNWAIPVDIIKAFDVMAICPEHFSRIVFSTNSDKAVELVDIAERHGLSADICNVNRLAMSAIFDNQIPRPHFSISATYPCDPGRIVDQIINYTTGVDDYSIDAPYGREKEDIDFFEKEVWKMIKFLQSRLGRDLDWERLKQSAERINKFNYYLGEVANMHRAIPSPGLVLMLQNSWQLLLANTDSEYGIKFAQTLYKIAKKRIEDPPIKIKKREKIRVIVWDSVPNWFDYYKWIEKKFGAVVVVDYVGMNVCKQIDTSTKESLVRGLAEMRLLIGMTRQTHGKAEFIADELATYIDEYSADCVILNNNIGCRGNLAGTKIVQDICKQKGIPILLLGVDTYNKSVVSEETIKNKLTDFFTSNSWRSRK